jgi:hypothetical protein
MFGFYTNFRRTFMKEKILYDEVTEDGKRVNWRDVAIHTDTEIRGFFGPYKFLSNFWKARVYLDKIAYSSVEVAYQASKWKLEDRSIFLEMTPR